MNTYFTTEAIMMWDRDSTRHVRPVVNDLVKLLKPTGVTKVTVLDIGSNIGKFIELLSAHVVIEQALLIEPVQELIEYSRKKFPNYLFESCLVSNKSEELVLYTPKDPNMGLSRILDHPGHTDPDDLRIIKSETVSTLLNKHGITPDIIKIDAEGHDIKIVNGIIEYLSESPNRPIIIFECIGGVNVDDIEAMYKSFGYTMWSRLPEMYSRDIFLLPQCKSGA